VELHATADMATGGAFMRDVVAALPYRIHILGWRRLCGRGGLMEGRWSDGTVAYHGFFGRVWVC
jgi:hypothetical protein